jgi:branched-chain amino acid transport system permease protein
MAAGKGTRPIVDYAAPEASAPGTFAGLMFSAIVPIVAMIAIALLLHFVVGPNLEPYPRRILVDIGITIILAVSLNIVNGYTGQFSIGHAAFMAAGGYVAAACTFYGSLLLWDAVPSRDGIFGRGELLLAAACIVGGIVAAVLGWVVGLPSLRLRGDYLAIVTLGFGEILRVMLQQTNPQIFYPNDLRAARWEHLVPPPLGGAQGFADTPKVTGLFWSYIFVGATILFAYRLKLSSYGRALLSIREDEIAAEAMGVNTTKLKVRAFMFAAFFAGIAGGLYAHQLGVILRPVDAGFLRSFDVIIIVVLGGLGSISGAVLAAIVLTILATALTDLAEYRMIPYALALILLMIFRPQGLFGVHEIWEIAARLWRRVRRAGATA